MRKDRKNTITNKLGGKMKEDKYCEICTSEPIGELQRVCGMCADNRVKDGIWKEEEKEERMWEEEK